MGMYDNVKCHVPLPDGYVPPNGVLQTKDLDCELSMYTITPEGRLLRNLPKRKDDSDFPGCLDIDTKFHGMLCFYDGFTDDDDKWHWHEYIAKFTDGQLVEITQENPETDEEAAARILEVLTEEVPDDV